MVMWRGNRVYFVGLYGGASAVYDTAVFGDAACTISCADELARSTIYYDYVKFVGKCRKALQDII